MQKAYSSDLTDAQWQVIKPVFADQRQYEKHSPRQIMNALFYLLGVRLPVANVAQRFRAVEDRLHSLPQVERKRAYRALVQAASACGAADGRAPPEPLRCRHRRAERADRASGRPRARPGRWQKRQGAKASCRGRHDGVGASGGRWPGQRKRGAKGPAPVQEAAREGATAASDLCRQRLRRHARRAGPCAASDGCSASCGAKRAIPPAGSSRSRSAGS